MKKFIWGMDCIIEWKWKRICWETEPKSVKSASQVGKSDIMNNVIGRFAHLDPCAVMMIQPTIEMAQDYSKSRISPMIRDTKALSSLFFEVKSRDSNNTILSKIFPGGRLIMCGANSPAGLASRPIRILLADEVDRPRSAMLWPSSMPAGILTSSVRARRS